MNRIGDALYCTGSNEPLVRALVNAGVEFIVVGGLAVAWYCPDRLADDLDLLIAPTPDNSKRLSQVLSNLNLNGHTPTSFVKVGLQVPLKVEYYADLLTPKTNDPSYFELARDAVEAKLFNIPIRVASVASLIRQKEQAVATIDVEAEKKKHIEDIDRLKMIEQPN